jgi:hypothetical protein
MRRLIGLVLTVVAFLATTVVPGLADETVTTTDGRKVLLRADGRYEVISSGNKATARMSVVIQVGMNDFEDSGVTQHTCHWHTAINNDTDYRVHSVRIKLGTPQGVFVFAKEEYRKANSEWWAINDNIILDEIGSGQSGTVDFVFRKKSENSFMPIGVDCDQLDSMRLELTKCEAETMPEGACKRLINIEVMHP